MIFTFGLLIAPFDNKGMNNRLLTIYYNFSNYQLKKNKKNLILNRSLLSNSFQVQDIPK